MTSGFIAPDDASFRAICMLLAGHPQYASLPLRRVPEILRAVRARHVFAAVEGTRLRGVILWTEASNDTARRAIGLRKLPAPAECADRGEALVTTAFFAESIPIGRRLWDDFLLTHRGRTILYERHKTVAGAAPVFKWMDKAGRLMGPQV